MNAYTKLIAIIFLTASLPVNAIILGDKDWLQVTTTTSYSWYDFDTIFDTSTGMCDVTGCLLDNGITTIDLTGYIWADNMEINDMLIAEIGGAGLPDLNIRNAWVTDSPTALDNIFTQLDPTVTITGLDQIRGWSREGSPGVTGYGDYIALLDYTNGATNDRIHLEVGVEPKGTRTQYVGGWLYKAAEVPEPPIIALLVAGLAGFGFARRRILHS